VNEEKRNMMMALIENRKMKDEKKGREAKE
jgi:hypothetical protein